MSEPKGYFGWYELMTTDVEAAGKFYRKIVGWTTQNVGNEQMPYSTFNVNDFGVAGLMSLPEEAGPVPAWVGYIHVDSVDDHAQRLVQAGGTIHKPPTDVPGMLRFCVVTDPQGAPFVLFTANSAMPTPQGKPAAGSAGTVTWSELLATDGDSAFQFYAGLFGFTKGETYDMGPMGKYQVFAIDGVPAGGIMTKPPFIPVSFWNFYIQVDGINQAADSIKASGGKITHGPSTVPGGSWILQASDPQGAMFCLISTSE